MISMRKGIGGDVARVLIQNLPSKTDASISRLLRDISINGFLYSDLEGLKDHDDIQKFFDRNSDDILAMSDYLPVRHTPATDVEYGIAAFDLVVDELMTVLKI